MHELSASHVMKVNSTSASRNGLEYLLNVQREMYSWLLST